MKKISKTLEVDHLKLFKIIGYTDKDMEELKKEISEREKMAIDLIKNLKIDENEYSIGNLRIQPNYLENSSNIRKTATNSNETMSSAGISNYEGIETISIVTKNIDKAEEFYEKLSELKLQSNNIEVHMPEYFITNIERYKRDLIVDA